MGLTLESRMSKAQDARWMRRVKKLLPRGEVVQEMLVVQVSPISGMILAVLKGGRDKRFRLQGNRLIDEATIGDARVA